MSTMVVQERHLWLNLAERKDVDKAHFLDAPHLPGGAVQRHRQGLLPSSSRRHHPPLPPGPGLILPVAVGALLHPPASSRAARPQAESIPRPGASSLSQESGFPRVPARPQVVQEVDEAALMLFLGDWREQRRSFPRWRVGRRILCFVLFCSAAGPRDLFSLFPQRKSYSLFLRVLRSMGRLCATALLPHSRPRLIFASSQESTVRGRCTVLSVNEFTHLKSTILNNISMNTKNISKMLTRLSLI